MQKKIYKLLLVGILNDQMNDLYTFLSGSDNQMPCTVQLCSEDVKIFEYTIKPLEPDLVIVNLMRLDMSAANIFSTLRRDYPDTIVLCIGTEAEHRPFKDYFKTQNFFQLFRPIENADILKNIYQILCFAPPKSSRIPEVLFIDDDPVLLRTMRNNFKDKYDIIMATSGEEALFQLESREPDCIFLDYQMPGMNGGEVLAQLRASRNFRNVPVYFLTSMQDKEIIKELLELKPNGYFLKPVELVRIASAIENSVKGK